MATDSVYRSGLIAVHTSTLIIFGSYSSSMYPAVCVEAVDDKQGQGDKSGILLI